DCRPHTTTGAHPASCTGLAAFWRRWLAPMSGLPPSQTAPPYSLDHRLDLQLALDRPFDANAAAYASGNIRRLLGGQAYFYDVPRLSALLEFARHRGVVRDDRPDLNQFAFNVV